jgi:hypothetical protein
MLRAYQGYQPKQTFFVVFTAIILWIPLLFLDRSETTFFVVSQSPLFTLFPLQITPSPTIGVLLSFLFWSLLGYMLLWLNQKHLFLENRTFIPFLIIMVIPPLTGFCFLITSQVLTIPFIFLSIDRIISSYRKNGVDFTYFVAGWWIGIASLFWIQATFLLILIFIGLLIFRPFYLREWLVSILGFLTPWYLITGIYFFIHLNLDGLIEVLHNSIIEIPMNSTIPVLVIFLLVFVGMMILVSGLHLINIFNMTKLKNRKVFQLFFWLFLLFGTLLIIYPQDYLYYSPLILIPVSIPLSKYFSVRNNIVKRILFDLMIFLGLATTIFRIIDFPGR